MPIQLTRRGTLFALTALCASSLALTPVRTAALEHAGALLVSEDGLTPADMMVIGPDAGDPGLLEAADLVKQRLSTRVALLGGPVTAAGEEFARRGVGYEDASTRGVRLLRELGATRAELLRLPSGGTEEAGRLIAALCARERLRSIIVITGADHSRRFRRVLRRSVEGSDTRIIVRPSRYSTFVPRRWWLQRATFRTGVVELEKLFWDVVRHPLE